MQSITTIKEIAQTIYYIALSIAGPIAVLQYLRAKKKEQEEREYKTYDELDRKFFEYQKLALQYYDLDILDVPNNDPSLAFDKKRKQEQVAFAILFSLFERAFLMFSRQTDAFKQKQWSGWKHFMNDFIRRDSIRTAWQMSKGTYDTDFQAFMDAKIAEVMATPPTAVPVAIPVVVPTVTAIPVAGPVSPNQPVSVEPTGSVATASAASPWVQNQAR